MTTTTSISNADFIDGVRKSPRQRDFTRPVLSITAVPLASGGWQLLVVADQDDGTPARELTCAPPGGTTAPALTAGIIESLQLLHGANPAVPVASEDLWLAVKQVGRKEKPLG